MKADRILFISIICCCMLFSLASVAQSRGGVVTAVSLSPLNNQDKVLTVKTPDGDREYSLDELEALGLKQLQTTTYWDEDNGVYQGVLLADLLRDAGIAKASSIKLSALDDYMTTIPRHDWEKWPILLATRRDGKPMSVRKRGPVRIIYPKDLGGEIAKTEMRLRWIWAIRFIEVDQ